MSLSRTEYPSQSAESSRMEPPLPTAGDSHSDWFFRLRQRCGEFVDNERTQMFILLLITVNSVMIGVATYPIIRDSPRLSGIFEVVDMSILLIFTLESMVQLFFNGMQRFFRDCWLVFDLVIVAISWISVEVETLRAFRVFRAFRFVTQVSVLRNIVVALFSIVPAITAIFTLLMLIFYIFAVMFTTLFKATEADYFGRMDETLFTLFQFLCLDEWSGIMYEMTEEYYWSWAISIMFIVMSAFVVINLLIAVICDALQILRVAEEAMQEKNQREKDLVETEEHSARGGLGFVGNGGGADDIMVGGDLHEEMSNQRMRHKIMAMQRMLEDMASSQENMARTIQFLTLALNAERRPFEVNRVNKSIREASSK